MRQRPTPNTHLLTSPNILYRSPHLSCPPPPPPRRLLVFPGVWVKHVIYCAVRIMSLSLNLPGGIGVCWFLRGDRACMSQVSAECRPATVPKTPPLMLLAHLYINQEELTALMKPERLLWLNKPRQMQMPAAACRLAPYSQSELVWGAFNP